MCTVVYLPTAEGFLLSSNRDENPGRPAAAPAWINCGSYRVLTPVDQQAGGSWMGLREDGAVLILLNGGFENHQKQAAYRKSRGLVLLDLLAEDRLADAWQDYPLQGIEPFTLIARQQAQLHRLVWTGTEKHALPQPANAAALWSSATLYSPQVQLMRQQAFEAALADAATPPDAGWLLHFLQSALPQDTANRFVMQRGHSLATLSISLVACQSHLASLQHTDLTHLPPVTSTVYTPLKPQQGEPALPIHGSTPPAHLVY